MDDTSGGSGTPAEGTIASAPSGVVLTPQVKLTRIRFELADQSFEREEVITGLLVGLLTGQHVCMLGPPGTDKSRLARALCARLPGARVFQRLLTRHTQPEELFGPIDVMALERGEYRRIVTGRLPEADIVFLDEVFKGSSVILNTLLEAMNERTFNDGTDTRRIPLRLCVGASNELPNPEDGLGAFYDRFLLRYHVDYLEREVDFDAMLKLPRRGMPAAGAPAPTVLTGEDLEALQTMLDAVTVPWYVSARLLELRKKLAVAGIVVSDRRWHDSVDAIRAHAVLHYRTEASVEDLAICMAICWNEPDERKQVVTTLQQIDEFVVSRVRTIGRYVQAISDAVHKHMLAWQEAVVKLSGLLYDLDRVLRHMDKDQQQRHSSEILLVRQAITNLRDKLQSTARSETTGSVTTTDLGDHLFGTMDIQQALREAADSVGTEDADDRSRDPTDPGTSLHDPRLRRGGRGGSRGGGRRS